MVTQEFPIGAVLVTKVRDYHGFLFRQSHSRLAAAYRVCLVGSHRNEQAALAFSPCKRMVNPAAE